jgi:two-component system OmpR family sensor kinase
MDKPRWYRSLYWRMAIAALAGLAGLLLAQAALFLWLAGTGDRPFLDGSPSRIVRIVTLDLTGALEADPSLDLGAYVRDQFARLPWRVYVVRPDGSVLTNRDFRVPREAVDAARRAFDGDEPPEPPEGRRGPGRGRRFGRVVAGGRVVAVVGLAAREGPLVQVFREYGAPLAGAAVALLVAGAGGMVLFVLAPVRRRLRGLQAAADALGAGDPHTRAPETGGDEVAALAKSFNRMAADLEARLDDLKESDRVRRQLLADVSHELMTPLTAMRGYLETLALPGAVRDEPTRDRYLHIVTDETLRLESIVGDLLDLARLEGGGTTLDRQDVPVSWLFERVAERHGVRLAERHITLDRHVAAGAEHVEGDARRLEQVVQNLAANAVRHTPDGGRITLTAVPADRDRVTISVSDTGPGIPAEHLPHVFDRFYKVDAARTQAGTPGSGLGLSIVRAIVESHGGTVTAGTAPEGGARFDVTLPR